MIRLSIFPKFMQHLNVDELAQTVLAAGLDTTNVVIRDGYWCQPDSLATDLPVFLQRMQAHGINPTFATTGYSAEELITDPTPLALLADHGITQIRIGYFRGEDPHAAIADARRQLGALAPLCERHGIQVVNQVHHGTLIASASMAWHIVEGLPAQFIGVELDPGNQAHEGMEGWPKSIRLLGAHLCAWGVKDVRWDHHEDKQWRRSWTPCDQGIVDWPSIISHCDDHAWSGDFVLMPFYHQHDFPAHLASLKQEVAYLRALCASTPVSQEIS